MRKQKLFVIMATLFIIFLPGCSEKETIDPKVSYSVQERIDELKGKTPDSLVINKEKAALSGQDEKQLQIRADAWISTLNPTHQFGFLPAKKYLVLTYLLDDNKVPLYVPFDEEHPYKNIVMEGEDNGEQVFYLIVGREKETRELIEWVRSRE